MTQAYIQEKACTANHCHITMLGTGEATVTKCYNTCFALCSPRCTMLIDAGGGNGILAQMERAGIGFDELDCLFVTHAHTDHILGAVWVVRMVMHSIAAGKRARAFAVYGHDRALTVLDAICTMTLPATYRSMRGKQIMLREVTDGEQLMCGDISLTFFDIFSTKEKQFGFCASLPGGLRLACLGDEPFNERNRALVENADWLLCEAFCLERDKDIFKPHEKHHSTALEAGMEASKLNAGHLLLYHMEDSSLATRKKDYTEEAGMFFKGKIVVPYDLETVSLAPPSQNG